MRIRGRPRRRRLSALVLLACLVGCTTDAGRVDPRPAGTLEDLLSFGERDDVNVLFILVDTLRADHLSAYGYARDTDPVIQEMAATGVRFARHISQSSWTKCSMASLWTGTYPARSGVLRAPDVLSQNAVLPAEIFRDAGFRTAGIWRNGWIAPNFGFGQGFENYTQPKPSERSRLQAHRAPNLMLAGSDADIMRSAFAFLRAHGHQRWFLYLHLMDVHQYAYSPEEALFGTSYADLYDNAIRWVDGLIGHLLAELAARQLREKTLVVFAADHGEAFGEHGNEGHARDVYGEVTQTPLILSFPFRLQPGVVVESRSANVDLWPTVLELLGMPPLEDPDGRSRLPEIVAAARGQPAPASGVVFATLDQTWGRDRQQAAPLVAVNHGPWRLFHSTARPGRSELYHTVDDPREQTNRIAGQPEVARELTQLVLEHLDGPPAPWGAAASRIEIDALQLDQLRALGYGVR